VDYYTDAVRYTQVRVLEIADNVPSSAHSYSHGDVLVRSQVVGFKKIKFFTHENIGDGKLELPENEMHTTSYWITLERPLLESLPFTVSERQSGMFGLLHALESVATLLLMCDRRDLGTAIGERPPSSDSESAVVGAQQPDRVGKGAAPLLGTIANFTPSRMEDTISSSPREFFEANLYLFDAYPGGIGFSEPLFRTHALLVQRTRELIAACPCEQGCPSCVGPAGELAPHAKEAALAILDRLCA
jgi:DEAD/DEAH box helicase domain-containing protein